MENILITGGTGTLGHALVKRLYGEYGITIYSRDPIKQLPMKSRYPDAKFVSGDIRDYRPLYLAMIGHDTVIHAAAQKHIPHGEADPLYTTEINVTGSQYVAQAALEANVKRVLGISTDKACEPINVYGMTKALMEKIFLTYNELGLTSFCLCRYGNVLGSTGSVVNVWKEMFARDGFVTATDPDMSRFWMTTDQAVATVLLALDESPGIIIPECAALDMKSFADYVLPGAEFRYRGLRPGEKRHETLLTEQEAARAIKKRGAALNYWWIGNEPTGDTGQSYASNTTGHILVKSALLEMIA